MIVKNYDKNEKLFQPEKVTLRVKYVYALINKYIKELN